jgi:chromosome segregation ATPase
MKMFKKYAMIVGAFLVFSCSPTVVPKSTTIPTPPVQTESVKPSVEKVKDGVADSIKENSKVAEKLATQKGTIADQKNTIDDALLEAKKLEEKLKAKEAISEAEIASLSLKIEQIKKENAKLMETNGGLSENVRYLMDVLNLVRKDAATVSVKLDKSENELGILRNNNKTISDTLKARNDDVEKMQKQVLKSEKAAAKAKVWRNAFWCILGGFALWTIAKNVLMIYFPATRFRI